MGWESDRSTIQNIVGTGWATTPVAYDDVPFDSTTVTDDWIKVSIVDGAGTQISLGSDPCYRHVGIVFLNIFVLPRSSGDTAEKVARTYADSLATLFRGVTTSGVLFRTPSLQRIGERDGYYQMLVTVPYQRDEIF